MSILKDLKFPGTTRVTDTHDIIQRQAGNATWVNEFNPVVGGSDKRIAEVVLWLCYNIGLCSAIVGDFAMYLGGKLASPPDFLTIYVTCPKQKLSHEISILLQKQNTPAFSFGNVDFLFMEKFSRPGSNIFYIARCGDITRAIRFFYVESLEPCGPRSNIDFVHFLWTTMAYYCTNYALVVLPSMTAGNKLIYMRHYKAEIQGDESRACSECVLHIPDIRSSYSFGCKKPEPCTCTLCLKQPLSLKSVASEIMFRLVNNLDKFSFDQDTTYHQYIFAVRYGAVLKVEQLVPFPTFPCMLTFRFILYDNASLGHYHESCALAVDVRNGAKWMDSTRYQFERPADFVGSITRMKGKFWCAHCEKALFSIPRRLPCQGLSI